MNIIKLLTKTTLSVLLAGFIYFNYQTDSYAQVGSCECRYLTFGGCVGVDNAAANTPSAGCNPGYSVPSGCEGLNGAQCSTATCTCIVPTPTSAPTPTPVTEPNTYDCVYNPIWQGTLVDHCTTGVAPPSCLFGACSNCTVYNLPCLEALPPGCDYFTACNVGPAPPVRCPGFTYPRVCCQNSSQCPEPPPTPTPGGGGGSPQPPIPPYNPCEGVINKSACLRCLGITTTGRDDGSGRAGHFSYTAIGPGGCIPVDAGPFAAEVIKILFGIAGGVAFLLILYGAFICITSGGDPQKAQACKETITSAIVGLLMLIFSLLIIRLIFGQQGLIPFIGNLGFFEP